MNDVKRFKVVALDSVTGTVRKTVFSFNWDYVNHVWDMQFSVYCNQTLIDTNTMSCSGNPETCVLKTAEIYEKARNKQYVTINGDSYPFY